MGEHQYVSVAVAQPLGRAHSFSYRNKPEVNARRGDLVAVPFGRDVKVGVVLSTATQLPPQLTDVEIKEIMDVFEPRPLLDETRLQIAEWLANHYKAPIYQACALMLPPASGTPVVRMVELGPSADAASLSPAERKALELLAAAKGPLEYRKLAKELGRSGSRALNNLLEGGALAQEFKLKELLAKPAVTQFLRPLAGRAALTAALGKLDPARDKRRIDLLEHVAANRQISRSQAVKQFGAAALKWAEEQKLVELFARSRHTGPVEWRSQPATPPMPTAEQRQAIDAIAATIGGAVGGPAGRPKRPFLLFGTTGSGKTEVYLNCVQACLDQGLSAIVLVPEIALSPPMLDLFAARFPGNVAVLHSGLTPAQRRNEWAAIRAGDRPVVLGTRSAVFAPVPKLGLIAMDEEHEWTYKQNETAPQYHARTVAAKIAQVANATLVLGSATPDVETFRRAEKGDYALLTLTGRPGAPSAQLSDATQVQVVDMRRELAIDPTGIISRTLDSAIKGVLERNGKVILFINRLGTASLIQCRDCGEAVQCSRCDARMTLHQDRQKVKPHRLRCHYCGHSTGVSTECGNCGGKRIARLMPGAETVEQIVGRRYPQAGVLRWDSDTAHSFKHHKQILEQFSSPRANILVGTQMVVKGLDIHAVQLAAVVSADSILMIPDFRSDERLFQAVTQLMGRTGRGEQPGRAVIQTYSPAHYALETASRRDYEGFYAHALDVRARHNLPPYSKFLKLVYSGYSADDVRAATKTFALELYRKLRREGHSEVRILGPSPLYPFRVRNRYRMQLVVKGPNPADLINWPSGPNWKVDTEPLNLS